MKKKIIFFLLAIILAAGLIFLFLGPGGPVKTGVNGTTQKIVVAAVTIPPYTEITKDMLTTEVYPKKLVPSTAYEEIGELVGATSRIEIAEHEAVLKNHIVTGEETTKRLSESVENGMRAMSVSVDAISGISGLLKVDDSVDVVVSVNDSQNSGPCAGAMLLQNVKVLALDQKMVNASEESEGGDPYETVTLSVRAEDTVKLAWAFNHGVVYLVLRNGGDTAAVPVSPYCGLSNESGGGIDEY